MTLCAYRHMFGTEGQGVHGVRILGVAAADLALAMGAAVALSMWLGWHPACATLFVFVLGVLVHRFFCVNTAVNVALFGAVGSERATTRSQRS